MDNKRQHDPRKYAPYKLDELMKGNVVVIIKIGLKYQSTYYCTRLHLFGMIVAEKLIFILSSIFF